MEVQTEGVVCQGRRRNPVDNLALDDERALIVQTALSALRDVSATDRDRKNILGSLLELSKAPEKELADFLAGKTLSVTNPLNEACHFFQKMNLLTCLIDLLLSDQAPAYLKEPSLDILRNLSRHHMNRILMFRTARLVEALRSCATTGETHTIKELALITLNNLALTDTNAARLYELDGYVQSLLLGALQGETPNIRLWSLGNLRNLAVSAHKAIRMREPPLYVDRTLIHCARKDPEGRNTIPIRCTALWALVNMACGGNNRTYLFNRPGLLDTVVEAARCKDTRKHALRALLSFSVADENRMRLYEYPGLLRILIGCYIEKAPDYDNEAAEDSLRILCELALDSVDHANELYTKNLDMIHASLDMYNNGKRLWPVSLMRALRRSESHLEHFNLMIILCSTRDVYRLGKHSKLVLLSKDIIRLVASMLVS